VTPQILPVQEVVFLTIDGVLSKKKEKITHHFVFVAFGKLLAVEFFSVLPKEVKFRK
jgi:hypothetical protein